jgi:hypothetical protein
MFQTDPQQTINKGDKGRRVKYWARLSAGFHHVHAHLEIYEPFISLILRNFFGLQ